MHLSLFTCVEVFPHNCVLVICPALKSLNVNACRVNSNIQRKKPLKIVIHSYFNLNGSIFYLMIHSVGLIFYYTVTTHSNSETVKVTGIQ